MNPASQKNSVNRRVLATTIKFGRKFPRISNGIKLKGQIARSANSAYTKEIARILIKNKELFEILYGEKRKKSSPEENFELVANWALEKTKTTPKAIELLNKIEADFEEAFGQHGFVTNEDLKRIFEITKKQGKTRGNYTSDLEYTSRVTGLAIKYQIKRAIMLLKGQKPIGWNHA